MSDVIISVGAGWNAITLTPLNPQPATTDIMAEPHVAGDFSQYMDGNSWLDIVYNKIGAVDSYGNLLTQLGLASAEYAKITLHTVDHDRVTAITQNGTVHRPRPSWRLNIGEVRFRVILELP